MATAGQSKGFRPSRGHADPQGYYRLLGIDSTASNEDIRLAFRDRAKKLHPDHGGRASDTDAFRRLLEAYEVLRDDNRRRAYDKVANAESSSQRRRPRQSNRPQRRQWRLRTPSLRAPSLWIIILLLGGFLGMTVMWRQSEQSLQEHKMVAAQLYARLDRALADQAAARTRSSAVTFGSLRELREAEAAQGNADGSAPTATMYRAAIQFPLGSSAIADDVRQSTDRAITELSAAIVDIPRGRNWLIMVESHGGPAAEQGGVAINDWEPSLLRIGALIDYLVANDMPENRLAARFVAGFDGYREATADPRVVEIKLLCCAR